MRNLLLACLLTSGLATVSAAEPEAEPLRLRVLSYNIHHAEGVDRELDLERIAKTILAVEPDLVALQEVDQNVTRSGKVDQPKELARLTRMHVAFGQNIPLQGGGYGNAVLSRHKIVQQKNHRLPNVAKGEQRGVLEVEIAISPEKESLRLFATHLDHRPDDRERQESAQAINALVEESKQPAILAGDMNDVPGSATLQLLQKAWQGTSEQELPTIPVGAPKRQIDFVLVRPAARWKVLEVRVLEEAVASDHRAILAVLELR